MSMLLMPPAPDVCQKCAVDHPEEQPHNQQSLFWQYWFCGANGRWPTWGDALAHCPDNVRKYWIHELRERGVKIETGPTPGREGSQ